MGWLLEQLPSQLDRMPMESAINIVWNSVGGPREEVPALIEAAASIGLVDVVDGSLGRLPLGTRVRQRLRDGDRSALGLQVLRSGVMATQARLIVETAVHDPLEDCFRCPRSVRLPAAQLIEILRLEEDDVLTGDGIRLSRHLYELVGAVWVFLEPAENLPPWLRDRQLVGHIAELFSWNHERLSATDPSLVTWVSRDDDSLGYDIENRNQTPTRRIEVKGSQGGTVSFVLTDNEMEKARQLRSSYEIQFWGRIDPTKPPQLLYDSLVALGYPTVIVDPVTEFDLGGWDVRPSQYRVSKK